MDIIFKDIFEKMIEAIEKTIDYILNHIKLSY